MPSPGPGFRGGRFYKETDENPNITRELIVRVFSYFKPYWKLMSAMVISIIMISALGVVPAIITKNIIDIALPQGDMKLLIQYILFSFGILLFTNLISVGQSYLNSLVSKNIIRDLRMQMYRQLQLMPLRFFSEVSSGEITSRMSNDIGGIEGVFSNTFVNILQGIFVFTTTATALFYINWKLTIIALLTLPLFLSPTRRVGKSRWKIATQMQTKLAELTTTITETLNVSGTILVKIFTKENDMNQEFKKINDEVNQLGIRETLVGRWFIMTIQTFVSIGPLLIYLFGGMILIKYNDITVGGIVMFVSLVGRLYGPINTFANIHVDIVRSMALFERIFQYLDLKSEIVELPQAKALDSIKGNIRFDRVSFSYNQNTKTLQHINFEIKPGQMAAFVGPSGAGKTTITYLVPRLYDVTDGGIYIDDDNIKDITLQSLRNKIGMVTQDTFLFNTTIRNNLIFARRDATEEEIIEVCKKANIHDFITSLAKGYDTFVGERGIKLSGGEKQRISIARTLLKNPQIVILDEATSALDSNSEKLIQEAIDPLLKSRTSLVIAHRLSTITSADVIFVVKDGRIVEKGTHVELLNEDGVYKELYDKQFKD